MKYFIIPLLTIFGLVFEDSQKVYNEFPVYPGSILTGSSEFIVNSEKATISIFKSRDNPAKIRSYIIANQAKNEWRLFQSSVSSLSFSKGQKIIKVQIAKDKNNNNTEIVFYKSKMSGFSFKSEKEEDFSGDISGYIQRYPGSKRVLYIKRLTGSPHSTTSIYETLDSADSVISFYRNNINKFGYVKFTQDKEDRLLYFNSEKLWCIITAKENRGKTILIIMKYEK